jgi:uncharacterized protein YecT (DUF1311 family)
MIAQRPLLSLLPWVDCCKIAISLIDLASARFRGQKRINRLVRTVIIVAMNRISECILFLPLLAVVTTIRCHAQHMNEKDSPCPNAVTTLDMAQCFSKAKALSDEKLAALYKKLLSKLDGDDADRLVKVQRVWTEYREANCSAERALYQGGSAAPVVYAACMEAMTRARTEELQQTYVVRLKD